MQFSTHVTQLHIESSAQLSVNSGNNENQYLCMNCKPQVEYAAVITKHKESITREDGIFKCKICSLTSKAKFSLKRHIQNTHGGSQEKNVPEESLELEESVHAEKAKKENSRIENFLEEGNLSHLIPLMNEQKITLEILFEMEKQDFNEINIKSYGDRHILDKLLKQQRNRKHNE